MAKIHSEDIFWTTDMGLATALKLEFPIEEIDNSIPNKVAFGFIKTADLDDYVKMFWNKGLTVEPQAFYNELLMLRKRINQELNN